MLTPRQVETAQVEPIVSAQPSTPNEQTSREPVWRDPPEPEPVSAGEVEHRQCLVPVSKPVAAAAKPT
jgi:hypothetical protein